MKFLQRLRSRLLRRAEPPAEWLRLDRHLLGDRRFAFDLRTPTLSLRTPTRVMRTPTLGLLRTGPGPDFVDTLPGLAPGRQRR